MALKRYDFHLGTGHFSVQLWPYYEPVLGSCILMRHKYPNVALPKIKLNPVDIHIPPQPHQQPTDPSWCPVTSEYDLSWINEKTYWRNRLATESQKFLKPPQLTGPIAVGGGLYYDSRPNPREFCNSDCNIVHSCMYIYIHLSLGWILWLSKESLPEMADTLRHYMFYW